MRKIILLSLIILLVTFATPVSCIANSDESIYIPIVSLINEERTIDAYEGMTKREMRKLKNKSKEKMSFISFSPNGDVLAHLNWRNEIVLWNIASGKKSKVFQSHSDPLSFFSFSIQGRKVKPGEKCKEVTNFQFSPLGKKLTSHCLDKTIVLWDILSGKKIGTIEGFLPEFSSDDKMIASFSKSKIFIWNTDTGEKMETLQDSSKHILRIAFSPDDKTLASGDESGNIIFWNTSTWQKTKKIKGHSGEIKSLHFSPDNSLLASAGKDKTIILWNTKTGEKVKTLTGHSDVVVSAVFLPDGKTLGSGSIDKTIIIWDITTGEKLSAINAANGGFFDETGSIFATIEKGEIVLRYARADKIIGQLTNQSGKTTNLAFSKGGKYLGALVDNVKIKLWNIPSSVLEIIRFATEFANIEGSIERTVNRLQSEKEEKLRAMSIPPKGEFETTTEYNERKRTSELQQERIENHYDSQISKVKATRGSDYKKKKEELIPYSFKLDLGTYDADNGRFVAEIYSQKIFINVPRDKAIQLSRNNDKISAKGMLRYYNPEKIELVNCFLVDEVSSEMFAFGKHSEEVIISTGEKVLPSLEVSSISLSELSGNGILDAGESGIIKVSVKNKGNGMAFGVSVSLKAPDGVSLQEGIQLSDKVYIGMINPHEEKSVEIKILALENIHSSDISVKVRAIESNGFDSKPVMLVFKTKELIPPVLQISKVNILTANGKRIITKGVQTEISLTVQNAGQGIANDVVAEIDTVSSDIKVFSERGVPMGMLLPGESRKAVFSIMVTERYSGKVILPVFFRITEKRERFSYKPDIDLTLNQEAPKIRVVKVKPVEKLVIDIKRDDINIIPNFNAGSRGNDIAIIIGIEKYQNTKPSDYSYNDAKLMKAYVEALGFQERNIDYLIDEMATKSAIKKSLEAWLPNRVNKNSRVFIYYSGHGSPDTKGNGYIVPYDADTNYMEYTGYKLKELYTGLGKLEVKEVMVVIDSCFSGSGGRSVLPKGARPLFMEVENPILASDNMAVLSSSSMSQISTSYSEKEHGLFTYYFLKALKERKKSLSEIYSYIKPLVEDEAKRMNVEQSPVLITNKEWVKGKFILLQSIKE